MPPALWCPAREQACGPHGVFAVKVIGQNQIDLCLAKTSYTRKVNDLAKSSIRTVPIRFLP